jgi:glycine/D-amino acid oxidase-like deaminating enzyme
MAADPGEPCPPLDRDTEADVVILGGGYTGMWTAYFLKDRDPGIDVVLLEQDVCGGGPSGRNGGFCNGFWEELDILVRALGPDAALETCRAAEGSIGEIGEWCGRRGVDAWYLRNGHMGVAASPAQDGAWRGLVEETRRLGVDWFRELSAGEVRERCASPVFRAGVLAPSAASLQPARLARGLRRVILELGVRIFEGTPIRRFRAGPPVEVVTDRARVRAPKAAIATGAWSSRMRPFHRAILPRGSYILVTDPAPDRLEEIGWTGGEGIYDFRSALHYLRTTPDGRIAFGAAGSTAGVGGGLGPRMDYDETSIARLVRSFHRMFPSFRDVPIAAAWGGPMDITGRHLPFFGTLPAGNLHYAMGYTGGGVAPCHMAGKILSGMILGIEDNLTRLPLVSLEPKRFPPEPLLALGAAIAQEAIVRRDEALDAGRRPNRLVDLVAKLPRKLGYELGP